MRGVGFKERYGGEITLSAAPLLVTHCQIRTYSNFGLCSPKRRRFGGDWPLSAAIINAFWLIFILCYGVLMQHDTSLMSSANYY